MGERLHCNPILALGRDFFMHYKITPLFPSFWRISKKSKSGYVLIGSLRMKSRYLAALNIESSQLFLKGKELSNLVKISISSETLQLESIIKKTSVDKITYHEKGLPEEPVICCERRGKKIIVYNKDLRIASFYSLGKSFILHLEVAYPPLPEVFILAVPLPFLN